MEEDHPVISDMAARPSMTMRFYYSKRNYPSSGPPTFLEGGQPLPNAIPGTSHESLIREFEVGGFYEIDHGGLPPKSPAHLKFTRVVMVTEKTKLGITVAFPSLLSLKEYFIMEEATHARYHGKRKLQGEHPDLDEQFVVGAGHAARILRRLVPRQEVGASQHLEGFWLLAPLVSRSREEGGDHFLPQAAPDLKAALQSAELSSWGMRRKVTYITRNKGKKSPEARGKSPELPLAIVAKEEAQPVIAGGERPRKRKKMCKKRRAAPKLELARPRRDDGRPKSSKDRWSPERYTYAEMKLLDIMKEKNAVLGNPILRQHLRVEARKHIGDTGLLDHLLKHMAGKVVFGGTLRFRRGHNPDGAMEYWLEDADLENLRLAPGIHDAHGTSSPCCRPCGMQLSQVKEELSNIRRELEQFSDKKKAEEGNRDSEDGAMNNGKADEISKIVKEMREEFLEWRANASDQLSKLSTSLQEFKDQIGMMTEELRQLRENQAVSNAKPCGGSEVAGEQKGGRKSGFRLCKPQGTFLWPDMVGGMRLVGAAEEVPTPPSASSVTSPPPLPPPPVNPHVGSARADVVLVSRQCQHRGHRYHFCDHDHVHVHAMQQQHPTVVVGEIFHHSPLHHGLFSNESPQTAGKMKGWSVVGNEEACSSAATISTDLALASPTYRRL